MFLHIMVGQNPKMSNAKKLCFLVSYDVMLDYIYTKKCHYIFKNENIFKISLK